MAHVAGDALPRIPFQLLPDIRHYLALACANPVFWSVAPQHPSHRERVALAVLDLGMPGKSGPETMPDLLAVKPNLDVVVSSGYAEAETMRLFNGLPVALSSRNRTRPAAWPRRSARCWGGEAAEAA